MVAVKIIFIPNKAGLARKPGDRNIINYISGKIIYSKRCLPLALCNGRNVATSEYCIFIYWPVSSPAEMGSK